MRTHLHTTRIVVRIMLFMVDNCENGTEDDDMQLAIDMP